MVAQISVIMATAIGQCAVWFNTIVAASGSAGIYIATFFLLAVGRFLLSPVFGTAVGVVLGQMGSDKVNRRYRDLDGDPGIPGQKRLN